MPKKLNSRCKEFVASLIEYFEQERDNNGPLLPLNAVRERVASALKLNLSTVSNISQSVKDNVLLNSPPKKRLKEKTVTNTTMANTSAIRNTIYSMYEMNQHVTLGTLLQQLKEKQIFSGSKMSLSRLLKDIGFKWKKDDPRRGLMELSNIAVKRVEFLRKYMQAKETALYKFVFIDETWIFQNGTVGRSWQDMDKRSVKTTKVDGKRYIVLHAGNEDGFIDGAETIFSSKTQLADYHGEMNQENFLKWFKNQLLLNLTEPSIIIMDNAPYHSMLLDKCPNTSWKKCDIQDWLKKYNIGFNDTMFKAELLQIVGLNKPPIKYLVDDLAEQYGHKVLRLPPYHCIFNPIELIWGIAKQYYNTHIGRDGKSETSCLNMWSEALRNINHEVWKKCILHTEKEIMSWYNRERILERQEITPIIIDIGDESDASDQSESDL